ncbi:MAG: WYL domain-containing transcriptional regulator [Clostridia bacterium]|nr:WYL domain-containing transcriptional regulator [Clostridia bacterium]
MLDFDRKSSALIRIYQILFDYSDADHPLTQAKIIQHLTSDYDMNLTRQSVSRHVKTLMELGIDISVSKKGVYLISRPLENYELILLIDSVLGSRHISSQYSDELIQKLIALGGKNFKSSVKHVIVAKQLSKTANKEFFYNIETISEAIEKERKISFSYVKYNENGELNISGKHTATPYQLLLHNQHYYLVLRDDKSAKVSYFRVDKITNIKMTKAAAFPLKENEGFKMGINLENFSTGMPYMFNDKPERVVFRCHVSMTDQLYDWFDGSVSVQKEDNEHLICSLTTSPKAMLFWALQYNSNIEIIAPQSLREEMIKTLKLTLKLYE